MYLQWRCIAAAVITIAAGAIAPAAEAASFGTDGIRFDRDTKVNFSFFESHGAYKSTLSIYEVGNGALTRVSELFREVKQSDNGGQNEWKGTFGNAVTSSTGQQTLAFNFLAGRTYTLGLDSGGGGKVYSTTALNPFGTGGTQQAVFGTNLPTELNRETTNSFRLASQRTSANPFGDQPVFVSFDDRGNRNDTDFQDFTVSAQAEAPESVPEPAALLGLGAIATGLVVKRREATERRR